MPKIVKLSNFSEIITGVGNLPPSSTDKIINLGIKLKKAKISLEILR